MPGVTHAALCLFSLIFGVIVSLSKLWGVLDRMCGLEMLIPEASLFRDEEKGEGEEG